MNKIVIILISTLILLSCAEEEKNNPIKFVIPEFKKNIEYDHYKIDATSEDGETKEVVPCTEKTENKKRENFYLDYSKSETYEITLKIYDGTCIKTKLKDTLKGEVSKDNTWIRLFPTTFELLINKLYKPKAFFSILDQEEDFGRVMIIGGADNLNLESSTNKNVPNIFPFIIGGNNVDSSFDPTTHYHGFEWSSMTSVYDGTNYYIMGGVDHFYKKTTYNKLKFTLDENMINGTNKEKKIEDYMIYSDMTVSQSVVLKGTNFNYESFNNGGYKPISLPGDISDLDDNTSTYAYRNFDNTNYEVVSVGLNKNNNKFILSNKVSFYRGCSINGNRKDCTPIDTLELNTPRYGHSIFIDKDKNVWIMGGIICPDEPNNAECPNGLKLTQSVEIVKFPESDQ